jgi:2-methylisocitrate lyase-like PEP mutase family enzyme
MGLSAMRALIEKPGTTLIPGAGSPLEMRLIEAAGFEAAYLSGYAAAAHRYGVPDIGLVALAEIEALARECISVSRLPTIVDCDNGYGDVANVRRTVQRLETAGVAAIQLEDQAWPKKCGHMEGKIVVERDVAVRKIRAAVEAREDEGLVLIARTDARAPLGLDEAIARCLAFRDVGADVLFVDAPQSLTEVERIARELPGPLLLNISESGKTPSLSLKEIEDFGIKLVIYPSSSLRVAVKMIGAFYADLKANGESTRWLDRMATLDETNSVLGLDGIKAFEARLLAAEDVR